MAKSDLLYAVAIGGVGLVTAAYLLKQGGTGGGGTYDVAVLVKAPSGSFPGALVDLGGQVSTSDQGGVARFSGVKGGQALLTVSATGYEPYQESVKIGVASTSFTALLTAQASCTPMNCPPGQVFDSALCQCSALIPAGILMNSSLSVDLWWHTQVVCVAGTKKSSVLNAISCPVIEPPLDPNDMWVVKVTGSVVDDHSHPIAGVPVEIVLSDASVTWADGNTNGILKFSAPPSVTTDQSGNFEADVSVTLVVQGYNAYGCIIPWNVSGEVVKNLTLSARVSGTLIQALTLVSMDNHICDFISIFSPGF